MFRHTITKLLGSGGVKFDGEVSRNINILMQRINPLMPTRPIYPIPFNVLCSRPLGKGAISVAFVRPSVRPSVCPSVAYISNNSRTQRPGVPKLGKKVPHLRCDSHTSVKVKRSKVRVTRHINAHTHRAPYLPNGKAYEPQTWYTDGGQRSASATAP